MKPIILLISLILSNDIREGWVYEKNQGLFHKQLSISNKNWCKEYCVDSVIYDYVKIGDFISFKSNSIIVEDKKYITVFEK